MGTALAPETSDAALAQAAQAGSAAAFDQLVARHREGVLALCFERVGHRETAEDIAQETFLRVWSQLATLRHPYAFGAWVRRIAVNLAVSRLRSDGRAGRGRTHLTPDEFEAIADDTVAARGRARAAAHDLSAALARLGRTDAELLRWHFADDLSQGDIARRLGVHPSTVCRRLDRALDHLRRELDAGARRSTPTHRGGAPRHAVPMAVALGSLSPGAWANAGSVGGGSAAAGASSWTGWGLLAERMLTSLLQGLGIMSTANKIAVVVGAVAVAAGGFYAVKTASNADKHLTVAVAQQVDSATSAGTLTHALGTESQFALGAGQSMTLVPGPNAYAIRDIAIKRGEDDVSALITFADGTTRVFNGGLSSGDFAMIGATNYVEDGSVEGTATTMPPGFMMYLVWDRTSDPAKFRVFTKANDAFGRDLMALQRAVESGKISNTQAMNEGTRLMRQHNMYPTGDAYRRAGAGFVP